MKTNNSCEQHCAAQTLLCNPQWYLLPRQEETLETLCQKAF